MREVLLTSICRPKQWKTISTRDLKSEGYPVYGANGKIGFYNTYTHENPTILITCRGATCGSINISEPKSYVNGNAMALDNLSLDVNLYFLKHYLEYRKLDDVISGSAQPQITGQGLANIQIPLPPLPTQQKIASILDAADTLRQKDKALLAKYDELTQSLFLDMFGDPVKNEKGWEIKTLEKVSFLTTKGSSPNWQGFEYILEGVRFVTSENVRLGYLDISKDKFVAHEFHLKLRRSQLKENDLLVNLVGASIGRGALVDPNVLPANINQAVAKTELDIKKVHPLFVLHQVVTPQVQERLIGNKVEGARANISLKNVRELELFIPPIYLQTQFAEHVANIEQQKALAQASLEKSEELFNSLLQKAFKGELV